MFVLAHCFGGSSASSGRPIALASSGGPDGNGKKHMAEQTVHFMSQEAKRKSHSPMTPMNPMTSHREPLPKSYTYSQ
jgi:hypothetical protein